MGILFVILKKNPYTWEIYSGVIELTCSSEKLSGIYSREGIEKFIQEQFSPRFKILINKLEMQGENKEVFLELFTQEDITDNIPKDFKVKSKWRELANLKMDVFNLSENDIISIAQENKIELNSIKGGKY